MKKNNLETKNYYMGMIAMLFIVAGLILAQNKVVADSSDNISAVRASWSMASQKDNALYLGADDSIDSGAQFVSSGKYQESKNISICAIVDTTSMGQGVKKVFNSIFYPDEIYLGANYSNEQKGCGQLIEQDQMFRLDKDTGIDLFCDKIKNHNNNLPTFSGISENYDKLCQINGELETETSAVFCGQKDLLYDDPAGTYNVKITVQNENGITNYQDDKFDYLPLTAFEIDFSSIEYGAVKEGKKKIVSGDLIWGNEVPTIRNVGNTRLSIEMIQEDMGIGGNGNISNIEYGAKIGESEKSWIFFSEGVKQKLKDPLNLSEKNEIDFSVFVYKFPSLSKNRFNGNFTLTAVAEDHLKCKDYLPDEIYLTSTYRPASQTDSSAKRIFVPTDSPASVIAPNQTIAPDHAGLESSTTVITPPSDLLDKITAPSISTISSPEFEPTPIFSIDPTPIPILSSPQDISPDPSIEPTPAFLADPDSKNSLQEISQPEILSDSEASPIPSVDSFAVASPEPSISPVPTITPDIFSDQVLNPTAAPAVGPEPSVAENSDPQATLQAAPVPLPDISPTSLSVPDPI